MKTLDLNFSFGFSGGYTAEDEATEIEFSNKLYKALKKIYQESGDDELCSILENEELDEDLVQELETIITQQKETLIELQHENGDDCDPDSGEPYDFDEMMIEIYINIPEDWE